MTNFFRERIVLKEPTKNSMNYLKVSNIKFPNSSKLFVTFSPNKADVFKYNSSDIFSESKTPFTISSVIVTFKSILFPKMTIGTFSMQYVLDSFIHSGTSSIDLLFVKSNSYKAPDAFL